MRAAALALLLAAAAPNALAEEMPAAIGRLTFGTAPAPGAAICTGTLVAPDLVLSAGHCLRPALAMPASVTFAAGYREGAAAGIAQGREIILAQGGGLAADVGLLRLDRPLGTIPPLAQTDDTGGVLARFAYRRDRPEAAEFTDFCLLAGTDGPHLRMVCGAVSGNSGAPVLRRIEGEWRIAGVMVASLGALQSVAVRIPPDLAALLPGAAAP